MPTKLPSTLGARPGKMNMTSLPKVDISRRFPERKPSPTPTSRSREPTPQAMPNMVRNERSLCAQRARPISPKVSSKVRIRGLSDYSRHRGRRVSRTLTKKRVRRGKVGVERVRICATRIQSCIHPRSSATSLGRAPRKYPQGYLRAVARAAVTCDYIVEAI